MYGKTAYSKVESVTNESSKIVITTPDYKTINCSNNNSNCNDKNNSYNNNSGDNNPLIDENLNTTEKLSDESLFDNISSFDDNLPLQVFPSASNKEDILELQKSQLYYINNGIKLPLEIRKLRDNSYALSISRNICENMLKRKCPCCVPLQGHIVQLRRVYDQEDPHIFRGKRNNRSVNQSKVNTLTTLENTKNNTLLYSRKEQNLINVDLVTIMPVLDFAKKYNLSYNFDGGEILTKAH